MKKIILFFLLISGALISQPSGGSCKITKVSPDPGGKCKITFKFIGPGGKPAISRIAIKLSKDSIIQPKIDSKGIFVLTRVPGTYNFSFFVKYWQDVVSQPIILKPKTNTFITVKFDAQEIGGAPVK
jgi:hypothetical protein